MAIIVWKDYGDGPQSGLTSVSYPLDLPVYPSQRSIRITPHAVNGVVRSPYTGQVQVQKYSYQCWQLEVTLPPMKKELARTWMAWLAALEGSYGSFLCGDQSLRVPQGTRAGLPLVNGTGQSGNSLITDGWAASSMVLRSGDWIQLGTGETTRLYMNRLDATSDGSGNLTLNLWPSLRESPADNAEVTIGDCKGTFMLAAEPTIDIDQGMIYSISFSAIEKL